MHLNGRLLKQYREIHLRERYSRGSCVRRYIADIKQLVADIPTYSILDYGCGKGRQYTEEGIHEAWGVMPTLFDPGVRGINQLPDGTFDGVICTGVLEHVPKSEIDEAIANLAHYADKWCFVIVGIEPTRKLLPNGRQAHVTLRPPDWWETKMRPAFSSSVRVMLGFEPSPGRSKPLRLN